MILGYRGYGSLARLKYNTVLSSNDQLLHFKLGSEDSILALSQRVRPDGKGLYTAMVPRITSL